MDDELRRRLDTQDQLLNSIFNSAEKTRKYFLWTLIITIVMFVLPLIGLVFVLPGFITTYLSTLGSF